MSARKAYFRVDNKILRKAWTNDELAGLVRLMAYLSDRWAREGIESEEAGYAEVSDADLMLISGKRRIDVAVKSAQRWAEVASMSVARRGNVTVILWHKYPEKQGLISRSGPITSPSAPAPAPAPARKKRNAAAPLPEGLEGDLSRAFEIHGKRIVGWNDSRRRVLSARLREHSADELVSAVHGYQYMHRQGASGDYDPAKHFTPETIFRASNVAKYIEAAAEAHGLGLTPPFKPDRILSKNERVMKDFFENDTSPLNPLAGLGEPKRWT